jgi:omega-amidase
MPTSLSHRCADLKGEARDALRVTTVQCELAWEDAKTNIDYFTDTLKQLKGKTDLIILPEMFTTAFMMHPETQAEPADGPTLEWMQEMAAFLDAAIGGSVAVKDQEHYYNRFYFVTPDGLSAHYDKRHLFRMGSEPDHYTAGHERVVIHYRGWSILPQVCYDLRFPAFIRNRNDYDLALFVANWPAPRRRVWRTLLEARALENQCFVVGVNRVGSDGMSLSYSGDSMVIDYKGSALVDTPENEIAIETVTLVKSELESFKEKFPAYMDADQFDLLD